MNTHKDKGEGKKINGWKYRYARSFILLTKKMRNKLIKLGVPREDFVEIK